MYIYVYVDTKVETLILTSWKHCVDQPLVPQVSPALHGQVGHQLQAPPVEITEEDTRAPEEAKLRLGLVSARSSKKQQKSNGFEHCGGSEAAGNGKSFGLNSNPFEKQRF